MLGADVRLRGAAGRRGRTPSLYSQDGVQLSAVYRLAVNSPASIQPSAITSFAWFLARWAKRMSWKKIAVAFGVSWDTVYAAVKMAVDYGLEHRSLECVTESGVDEVMWRSGKRKYPTVVYQINEGCRRLLWIGKDRKQKTLVAFFKWFGPGPASKLQAVATP